VVTRSYDQYCGIARALDLVGERWAMLVVRELVLGPKRFTDLRRGLPGIGTNVLAARLKELESSGVLARRTLPPPAASTVYELTEYGRELEEVVLAFGRWGAKSMGPRSAQQTLQSECVAVALTAFFRPEAAEDLRATVEFRFEDGTFLAQIDRGSLLIGPAAENGADLSVRTDPETLVGFLAGGPVPAAALSPQGDLGLLDRLPQVFPFGTA